MHRIISISTATNRLIAIDKGDESSSCIRFFHPTLCSFLKDSELVEKFSRVMENSGLELNDWIHEGVTAFHLYTWFDLFAIIGYLVDFGLSVDEPEAGYGRTPLTYAFARGHVRVVQLAQSRRCTTRYDRRHSSSYPWPDDAEHSYSIEKDRLNVIKLLLQKSKKEELDINVRFEKDRTRSALMLAAKQGYGRIVQELME